MHDYRESGNPPRTLTDPAAAYSALAASSIVAVRSAPIGHVDPDDEDMTYDLRTLPERQHADLTALVLRCDSLQEQVAILSKRLDSLDVWRGAVNTAIERHADWMQVRELRGEDGK